MTRLEHKMADLQEIIQPGFIAIDAITTGQKMMLTPTPFSMGAIVVGLNSCAVDKVGCQMVYAEPHDLTHLRFAAERGYGPMRLDDIEVSGNFPLDEVRYVVGKVEGPLKLAPDERVVFAGDCTSWEGDINGRKVKVGGCYKTTADVDAEKTESNDMLLKIFGSLFHCFRNRSSRHVHAKGCPVSVGAHVNYISSFWKIKNVNFDPRNLVPVNISYWQMRAMRLLNRVFG